MLLFSKIFLKIFRDNKYGWGIIYKCQVFGGYQTLEVNRNRNESFRFRLIPFI